MNEYYILIQFSKITVRITGVDKRKAYQRAYNLMHDLKVSIRKYTKVRAPHGGGEFWYQKGAA